MVKDTHLMGGSENTSIVKLSRVVQNPRVLMFCSNYTLQNSLNAKYCVVYCLLMTIKILKSEIIILNLCTYMHCMHAHATNLLDIQLQNASKHGNNLAQKV